VVAELPLNRYPDGQMTKLREKLAERSGHTLEGTWAANGSNEILTELLLAYGGPGHKAVLFEPTYVLHSRLAWLTHTNVVKFTLQPPFSIGARDVAGANGMHPHIVFVCSPNNPTGNAQSLDAIKRLAEGSDALIVVDEAYIEFGGETAQPLLEQHPNIVIVRTFSKAFALAGARLGYCLADPEVIGDLQRVRLPYHMSSLTQAAGIAALLHEKDAEAMLEGIRAERDRIVEALSGMDGFTVFPSQANFVLFTPPKGKPAREVWQGLLEQGVLVRDLSSVVPEALRVSAGTTEEVDRFLEAVKGVVAA
jgi:histidinol-phosphate aminotransferase